MTRVTVDTEDKSGDVDGVDRHAWSNSPVIMLLGSCSQGREIEGTTVGDANDPTRGPHLDLRHSAPKTSGMPAHTTYFLPPCPASREDNTRPQFALPAYANPTKNALKPTKLFLPRTKGSSTLSCVQWQSTLGRPTSSQVATACLLRDESVTWSKSITRSCFTPDRTCEFPRPTARGVSPFILHTHQQ